MKPGRTESPDSKINKMNEDRAKRFGSFFKADQPWDDARDSELLEGMLVHNWTEHDLHIQCGITWKSAYTRYCKLCVRLPEAASYKPVNRTDRTGTTFTGADLRAISLCTGEKGRASGGGSPAHIARILGRNEEDVSDWMRSRLKSCKGFFGMPKYLPGETEDQYNARLIHSKIK